MMQDVVIAGGGVMGSAAAWWLAKMQPGIAVTVVEPDPSYAKAATALSVASIRSQFSTAVNVQISRFGVDFIRNFAEHLGPDAGDLGLRENGYLFVTSNPDNVALMRELAEMQRSHGAATQILSADDLRAKYPWMNCDDLAAGSFGPRDEGWFDNMGLLGGFKTAARALGVRYVTDRVVGVQVAGGRVQGVTLEKGGALACGALINAAGTGATAIMQLAGLPHPVEPRKRTVFVIDAPNARHPEAPLLIDHGFYLRPEGPHWITATVPADDHACDTNDFDPDLDLFEQVIWEQLYHRAPGFDAVKVIRHWVGHYDYNTLDQNAIVGPHPELPNLYLMSGFSGHGLQQSPALGRGIAEHILHGGWQTLDLSDLGVERVLAGRAFRERAVV
jgi:FAD-dependent oxidoreductase domain-containing protein 1